MEKKNAAGYHQLLYFAKWFVMVFALIDLVSGFGHEMTRALMIDQCFTLVKIILLVASVFMHDRKAGLWLFTVFMAAELGYFYLIVLLSGNVSGMFSQQVSSYTIGTLVILVPTLLYYRNRQELLK